MIFGSDSLYTIPGNIGFILTMFSLYAFMLWLLFVD
jgi:hypothetical protein